MQEANPQTERAGQQERIAPAYSASGYDITPWTREQIETARARLTPEQERVAFHAATEAPFCGLYTDASEPGIYVSVVTGLPLFRSSAKFHSKSGWASFFEPIDPAHVVERPDHGHGMERIEIVEARAGAHLGHVFDDGPPPTGRRYCLNSAALVFYPEGASLPAESRPVEPRTAYFAAGCFWGVEDSFARIPGVMDVVSGYMGGHAENPSYQEVCAGGTGHAETVEVRFDPARISYARLLDAFFAMHDATSSGHGTDEAGQYRSAIFPADDEQAREAQAALARLSSASSGKRPVRTRLERATRFFPAEEYHQDYHVRHRTRG
ncbi:MAG: peptide-methionine (S)-S-oxide reductase MsrA [Candidatus Eisenbacteria bacterium]|nr:peptide-methionine (S)-S-oxide reductase MsrA [Candidatus Eisenbacteria bacterium]